ncbi:MAG TPA: Fis family transcriptional regulator, partial [Acidobacteria bacterium]|nr:Fis family transcriptional regulator [Acidobacteriota bacterium]
RRGDIAPLARHFLEVCARTYRRARLDLTSRAEDWLQAQSWPGNIR